MLTHDHCISRQAMNDYLQGWSDDEAATAVEDHLSHCDQCEQTISRLEAETRFISVDLGDADFDEVHPAMPGDLDKREDLLPDPFDIGGDFVSGDESDVRNAIDAIKNWNGIDVDASPSQTGVEGNIGNYELVERIGRGGMAEVYRAKHRKLGRLVAIKLLRVPRWHLTESLRRIEREMAALGRLNHPAIVGALDAGEQDGFQFLVTELVDGLDLGRIAKVLGPLPLADACEMIRVAAIGLATAHAQGIVHRDIKPSNLMLDRSGQVKILDFGLVHLDGWQGASVELTTVGQLLGTLDYMAPEQAERAEAVDHRSDVYALGATLFRLLCGRAPFAASPNQSPLEKLRLLATERPPHVATLRPEIPATLAKLIDSTLDRDPTVRPPSAAHLAEALQPFCEAADLGSLIGTADNKTQSAPAEEFDDSPPLPCSAIPAALKRVPRKSSIGRRIVRWAIGMVLASAAVYAGIVLVLETSKGQLVIESDNANIRVRVLSNGREYDEMELHPGANSTRLFAGQYEIEIDGPIDQYTLDKNQFTLQRGGVIVAKVVQREAMAKTSDDISSTNTNFLKRYSTRIAPDLASKVLEAILGPNNGEFRIIADPNDRRHFSQRVASTT